MACRQLNNLELSGQLPFGDSVWGGLPELETLDLTNNFVGGYLPPNIGTLKNLKTAKLSGNSLNGAHLRLNAACVSTARKCAALRSSLLSACRRALYQQAIVANRTIGDTSGQLPPAWGDLSNLETLELENNELRGPLAPQWSGLSDLKVRPFGPPRASCK